MRFSHLFFSSLRVQARAIAVWTVSVLVLAATVIVFWPMLDTADALTSLADSLPPEVAEPLGLTNFGTAAGYLNGELFAMLLPFIAGIMGLTRVSNQLADTENAGRVEILYTLPVPRCEIALARWTACVAGFAMMCAATWATVGIRVALTDMDVAQSRVATACVGLFLLGLCHTGIAYLVYGATATRGLVTGVPLVVLVVGYIVYAVLPMVDELSGAQRFSPWYWALGESPLTGAFNAGGCVAVLAVTAVALATGSALLARRDCVQA